MWTIVIAGAEWVKLRFSKMNVEAGYDWITIYQCADSRDCADPYGGEMLTKLSGSAVEHGRDGWILANGAMRIHFESDASVRREGFKAVWISSLNTTDPDGPGPECVQNEWPHTHSDIGMQSCELPHDWERLKADGYSGNLRTGGLGQKIILDPYTGASQFDTWVCHYSHRCARRAGSGDTLFDNLTPTCRNCALDAFIYDTGASMTNGCRNCACGDGSRMCGCAWCPDIVPDASFFPAGTIDGTAVTAAECHQSCFRAGYGHESCGTGTGLLNEYFNGGNALSCVAACMMRVGGRLPLDSAGSIAHTFLFEHHAADSVPRKKGCRHWHTLKIPLFTATSHGFVV